MPKRKRAASEGCRPQRSPCSDCKAASPPLTTANLERLQHSLGLSVAAAAAMPAASSSRSMSPNRNSTTHDVIEKLEKYNILIDAPAALPDELQRFVDDVVLKPRDPSNPLSPNARKIVQRRRISERRNEATGIRHIVPFLLFSGESDFDEGVEPVPYITWQAEIQLNSFFLPPCPDKTTKNTWGLLTQPKPDSCVGYVLRSHAAVADCKAPFSAAEEATLNNYILTKFMYLPFLTGQWKSPIGSENILTARCQAARDGATIVNYLATLYRVAYGNEPSPVDTCHFSVVGDVITGQIWMHYQHGGTYYMHKICAFAYDEQASLERARGYLHNIKDHALGARLQSIKAALPAFEPKTRNLYPAVAMSESGGPAPSLHESSASTFPVPLTPASVVSEPTKKRRRKDN
ncbi:hypothetical protein BDU57DRAFT_115307 [Ampelomyces quisqualis]|uniref:DUF7924 domain-containing protein n=1 Tax=Ampelomyces quisqualis TaxID=50730 RepID=A0A6A5Q8H9_AMPQU|nr:hypothetical protein BDU57DRAFT_115307 [Ampelomyces quisqualis]